MKRWKVVLASDHAGLALKRRLRPYLESLGCEVTDVGTHSARRCDYPDYAAAAGRRLAAGEFERGVFCCGAGLGMSIAANKVPGVRAALCTLDYHVEMARRHNDANVLCLGGRVLTPELAERLVRLFLETGFEGGRHGRRVAKLAELDGSARRTARRT